MNFQNLDSWLDFDIKALISFRLKICAFFIPKVFLLFQINNSYTTSAVEHTKW